jgi:hypothetical protein
LTLPTPAGAAGSPAAERVAGRTFAVEPNQDEIATVGFDFGPSRDALRLRDGHGEQRLELGRGEWIRGTLALGGPPAPVDASGAWADERTYVVQAWWSEAPWRLTWRCRFDGDRVRIEREMNVSFAGRPAPEPLEGRAVATPVA